VDLVALVAATVITERTRGQVLRKIRAIL